MDPHILTRRQVLKRFGAIGGSSMMIGAMDTWDLMGTASSPRPVWEGSPPRDSRVIVLGAGLSGLTVGYELGKLGYYCRVLEARDWVGGLMWTVKRGATHTEIGGETQVCDFDEGQYINAGAWRIPNRDQAILGYCKELGVPLEIFINWTDANFFYEDDPERGPLSGQRVRFREVKADLIGSANELLTKAMDQGNIDAPLSDDDKELLVQFLIRSGYLGSEDHLYRPPTSRGSQDRLDLGALLQSGFGNRVRSLYQGTGGPDPVFQPIGGMQQIPFAFQRAMGDRITLGAEVRQIRQTDDGVTVVHRDTQTGEVTEETADYCVCCLPMNVLKTIDVNLSPEMSTVIEETGHSTSAKMGLQMKRRFWEEDNGIYGGHLWSRSLQLGEFSYPSNGYFGDKGVLLGYYGGGGQAGLSDMSIGERVEHVLSNAAKVHPQIRDEFESAYSVWWEKVPFSLGAYGRTPPEESREMLSRPDGRIYFGSAGTGTRPAWLEGAVQAAWRTVESVHTRAMQE
jgi:monoamine oxidase